jgi:alpha-D-ribose 1-methylphosphonate 5-triphosphate diphosphatase
MLGAVAALLHDKVCDLSTAVALVTSGPAQTVGLTDRGLMEVGKIADVILAEFDGPLAVVRQVFRSEEMKSNNRESVGAVS